MWTTQRIMHATRSQSPVLKFPDCVCVRNVHAHEPNGAAPPLPEQRTRFALIPIKTLLKRRRRRRRARQRSTRVHSILWWCCGCMFVWCCTTGSILHIVCTNIACSTYMYVCIMHVHSACIWSTIICARCGARRARSSIGALVPTERECGGLYAS